MVPARRCSKSMTRSRRSHHALKPINLVPCPSCGKSKLPHKACANCGYHSANVSLEIKTEEK